MSDATLQVLGLSRESVQRMYASMYPAPKPEAAPKRQAPPRYSARERLCRESEEAAAHYQQIMERDGGKTVA